MYFQRENSFDLDNNILLNNIVPNNSTGLDLIDMWVSFRPLYFIEALNWSLIFRDPDDHSSEVEGPFDLDQEDSSSTHEQDQPWYWKILHRWSL
jgi:hypothetical protein